MSLTDDWKAGKLERGWYFIKNKARGIVPDKLITNDWLMSGRYHVVEVLAPCDYDHFVELTEKVKSLEDDNDFLKNGALYDFWEKYKDNIENIETKEQTIKQLRRLLKESIRLISCEHEVYEAENFIKEVNEVLNDN